VRVYIWVAVGWEDRGDEREDRLLADVIKVCRQPPRTRGTPGEGIQGIPPWDRPDIRSYLTRGTTRRGMSIRLLNVVEMSPAEIRERIEPRQGEMSLWGGLDTGASLDFLASRAVRSVFPPGIWESNDLWVVIIFRLRVRSYWYHVLVRVTARKYRDVILHLLYARRMFGRCKVIHRSRRNIDS